MDLTSSRPILVFVSREPVNTPLTVVPDVCHLWQPQELCWCGTNGHSFAIVRHHSLEARANPTSSFTTSLTVWFDRFWRFYCLAASRTYPIALTTDGEDEYFCDGTVSSSYGEIATVIESDLFSTLSPCFFQILIRDAAYRAQGPLHSHIPK